MVVGIEVEVLWLDLGMMVNLVMGGIVLWFGYIALEFSVGGYDYG